MKQIISAVAFGSAIFATPAIAQPPREQYKSAKIVCENDSAYYGAAFTEDQIPIDMEIDEKYQYTSQGRLPTGMLISDDAGVVIQWRTYFSHGWDDYLKNKKGMCRIFKDEDDANTYFRKEVPNHEHWIPTYPSNPSGNQASWPDVNYLYMGRQINNLHHRAEKNSDFKYYYYCVTSISLYNGSKAYFSDIFGSDEMDDARYALAFDARVETLSGKAFADAQCSRNTSYTDAEEAKNRALGEKMRLGWASEETGWRYHGAARAAASSSTKRTPHQPTTGKHKGRP